jgi:hypothetical protein
LDDGDIDMIESMVSLVVHKGKNRTEAGLYGYPILLPTVSICMDGWVDGWIDVCGFFLIILVFLCVHACMDGWMNRWMDGWIDVGLYGYPILLPTVSICMDGWMSSWKFLLFGFFMCLCMYGWMNVSCKYFIFF